MPDTAKAAQLRELLSQPLVCDLDLSGADLTDIVLDNVRLERVSLRGANLEGARFEHCTWISCDLSQANFSNCTALNWYLSDCKLDQADFAGASLITGGGCAASETRHVW